MEKHKPNYKEKPLTSLNLTMLFRFLTFLQYLFTVSSVNFRGCCRLFCCMKNNNKVHDDYGGHTFQSLYPSQCNCNSTGNHTTVYLDEVLSSARSNSIPISSASLVPRSEISGISSRSSTTSSDSDVVESPDAV